MVGSSALLIFTIAASQDRLSRSREGEYPLALVSSFLKSVVPFLIDGLVDKQLHRIILFSRCLLDICSYSGAITFSFRFCTVVCSALRVR